MKKSKQNGSRCTELVRSWAGLERYPFTDEARQELADALVATFDRIEDAETYVRDVLRSERECPRVADVFNYRRLSAAEKVSRKARDCQYCKGAGWLYEFYLVTKLAVLLPGEKRRTTERITEVQAADLRGHIRELHEKYHEAVRAWKHGEAVPAPPNQSVEEGVRKCPCVAAA